MYELIPLAGQTYYIDCPAKMGLWVENGGDAWLIDSGNDKDAGKKVQKLLAANGWKLKAIINTHSNADHIGGNRLLQDRLSCPVYAPGIEAAFTAYPLLEPSFLYGGYPPKALRNKFLMAQESRAEELVAAELPAGMECVPLPGHFFHMAGVRTPDGVFFLADCLTSAAVLEKYHISFIYDVRAYLQTLDYVESLPPGSWYVPAHADSSRDIRPLVSVNRDKVLEIRDRLLGLCREPRTFEGILKKMFDGYGLAMDFNQYVLVGSTIRSYLAWLSDDGLIRSFFEDNALLWQTA